MRHLYVWHDSFICVTWLIHVRDNATSRVMLCERTHAYVLHNSLRSMTCFLQYVWHDWFMCAVTDLYEWHDLFTCVTLLFRTCGITRLYAWHDSVICVMWPVTYWYVWHAWFICVTWHHLYLLYFTHVWHMLHSYVWRWLFCVWQNGLHRRPLMTVCRSVL